MNILIAADSFKDALPALEVCTAIAKGLRQANPAIQPQLFPMADGGEGTADILTFHNNGQQMQCTVLDPLGRPVEATYGISQDGQTAFMEMAQASGIQLLTEAERNPLLASTYGTGQLIAHALERGIRKIVLGIGGSATNDMGMGMLRALGYRFWDASAKELAGTGADLTKVTQFEESKRNEGLQDLELTIICDVDNPLYGPNGAAHVYGQQKGATPEMIQQLDMGLRQFATIIETQKGISIALLPGAGAAGGIGATLHALLGGQLRPGIQTVMQHTNFEAQLKGIDYIITGEGKIDHQTLHGKLIAGITQLAQQHNIPVIALCGAMLASPEDIKQIGLRAAFSIQQRPVSLSTALAETSEALTQTAFQIGRLL